MNYVCQKTWSYMPQSLMVHAFKVVPLFSCLSGLLWKRYNPVKNRQKRHPRRNIMLLLMFPTMKSITYKSEVISDNFEAILSWKLSIACFPVESVRQPRARLIMYGRNSNSLKFMCLLIPKHFLSVWTSLSSHWEILWSTYPNLPNAKFSFPSIPNFFHGMNIYWD